MWYLDREVTAKEWDGLANTYCLVPQRAEGGTYAFCRTESDSLIKTWLNHSAPGEWRKVA